MITQMVNTIDHGRFLFSIWMIVNTCFCTAQVSLDQNMYQINDLLERQQINPSSLSECSDVLVNLQNIQAIGNNNVEHMEWGTDSLIAIDNDGMHKYQLKGDSLLLIGTENRLMHIDYPQPETWLRFPMGLGDSISGLFEGKGQYCERLFFRKVGKYSTKADAIGSLLMENSDTLRHVLRLRTDRTTVTLAQPLDSMLTAYETLDNIPILGNDSIIRILATDNRAVRSVIQRYYVPGCRYPVLETCETSSVGRGESANQTVAFYSSPFSQASLASANRTVPTKSTNRKNDASSTGNPDKSLSYTLDIDTSGKIINVNCDISGTTGGPVPLRLLLCNHQGILYRQASGSLRQGESGQLSLCYAGLHNGSYVLYIEAGGQQYSEKFSVR